MMHEVVLGARQRLSARCKRGQEGYDGGTAFSVDEGDAAEALLTLHVVLA
jgi:hypothetical protein